MIDDTYRGYHYSGFYAEDDKNYNLALLKITRAEGFRKLVITTHPPISIGTIAQAFVEIPRNKPDRLLEGTFCNIEGYATSLVMYKESDAFSAVESPFAVGKLSDKILKATLKQTLSNSNETYQKVYDRLINLVRGKKEKM